nr:unnamed protein product [Brassica oleracea]
MSLISAFLAAGRCQPGVDTGHPLQGLSRRCMASESLCSQFWDRKSYVDGPIRCLLFDLESEFPFRSVEFIPLLASLSEGSWPAEPF